MDFLRPAISEAPEPRLLWMPPRLSQLAVAVLRADDDDDNDDDDNDYS